MVYNTILVGLASHTGVVVYNTSGTSGTLIQELWCTILVGLASHTGVVVYNTTCGTSLSYRSCGVQYLWD